MEQAVQDQQQQAVESLAKQVISRENITTCEPRQQCPQCHESKASFVGAVCFVCYWIARGEKFRWIACPKCGLEWSKLKENGECYDCGEKAEKDAEKKSLMMKQVRKLFGSERNFEKLSFENFTAFDGLEPAIKTAKEFSPDKDNLYLWGAPGMGKTHLAFSILREALLAGRKVDKLTMREMINRFRMTKPEEEAAQIEDMVGVEVLVIDDMGKAANSDFALNILTDILDKRSLVERYGLVITSNLFIGDLARQSGDDRLSSRITGMCKVIEVRSPYDYRVERGGI